MESVIPIQQTGKAAENKPAGKIADGVHIRAAVLLSGYTIRLVFSDGTEQHIDFKKPLKKYGKAYPQYLKPANFKKFRIDNGNLVWGKNWDIIFPIHHLYSGKIV